MSKLKDRREELALFETRYREGNAQLFILYGRRRIGKTELAEAFIEKVGGLRLLGRFESEKDHLKRFSLALADFFHDSVLKTNHFPDWDAFFAYIAEKSSEKQFVLCLDEFPYIVNSSPALASILQDYWDKTLKKSKIFLILCGSSISMMVKYILSYKSPLYGRRTGQLKLNGISWNNIIEFLPEYSVKERIETYAVFGGTPGYILECSKKANLFEDIKEKILKKDQFLFQDVEFVLREELDEPKYYFSILRSLSYGNTKIGEIMNDTGLNKGIVGKYLSVLTDLDIIERKVPVTEKGKGSRMGIYKIKDHFFSFWFRFVYPNIEYVEKENINYIIYKIKNEFSIFVSSVFEEICQDFIIRRGCFKIHKIGSWWHKGHEIDCIGFNEETKEIIFVECKWKDNVNAKKILWELKEKANFVSWKKDKRQEYYAIFAKSFKEEIKEKNVFLFTLKDLDKQ